MDAPTAAASPPPGPQPQRRWFADARTARTRLLADKFARWAVIGGGVTVIASILAILLFIVVEVAPLVSGATVERGRDVAVGPDAIGAILSDEYRSHAALLGTSGTVRVLDLESGRTVLESSILPPDFSPVVTVRAAPSQSLFLAATADGHLLAQRVDWLVSFVEQTREITPVLSRSMAFDLDPDRGRLGAFTAAVDDEEQATAAAVLTDGTLALVHRTVEENFLSGEVTESLERYTSIPPVPVDVLIIDADQRNLYGGNDRGDLLWWRLDSGEPDAPQVVLAERRGVTALGLLIGDRSLVVGHADGALSIWFPVRNPDESFTFTRIREFRGQPGAIRQIAPSLRNKGFLAADDTGTLGLFYSTSERTLWQGQSPVASTEALYFAPRADGAFVAGSGRLAELLIDNPHPEISFGALFSKVWYEGYPEPAFVWQSTGGTDDFESKLGITPLMVGTLKGTLYSLVLAIPLGVLGAMYTSQFMHHSLKRYIKPTVEIMAALPSVVLGFLAGLWLAPRVERIFPALLLMMVVLPTLVMAAGILWRRLPPRIRNAMPDGIEAVIQVGIVGTGIWLCLALNRPVAALVFGGSFQDWLLESTGLAYDQRNAVVVGMAMGFAVIPIIFSIAEDAFSNVPRNLVSGSLALGANRWQTVTRIVLPSASPGIFSGIMIGFGRAVGETMIVLMATGNTPIMDWSPFNGFRTLSANIAVEIPEAPQGATLYRTLFLAALILFLFTFLMNTLAELVRQHLRKRYVQT